MLRLSPELASLVGLLPLLARLLAAALLLLAGLLARTLGLLARLLIRIVHSGSPLLNSQRPDEGPPDADNP